MQSKRPKPSLKKTAQSEDEPPVTYPTFNALAAWRITASQKLPETLTPSDKPDHHRKKSESEREYFDDNQWRFFTQSERQRQQSKHHVRFAQDARPASSPQLRARHLAPPAQGLFPSAPPERKEEELQTAIIPAAQAAPDQDKPLKKACCTIL